MSTLQFFQQPPRLPQFKNPNQFFLNFNHRPPFPTSIQPNPSLFLAKSSQKQPRPTTLEAQIDLEDENDEGDGVIDVEIDDDDDDEFSPRSRFKKRAAEQDYDKNPEFAEILGACLEDPQKAQSKMADRLKQKKDKIFHTKTGSATPMKVVFNNFDFSNSFIWFEFYNAPLEKDVSLICNTVRSWFIIGRLGGCNSMNMQLSEGPMDKRPNYDAIQGANVTPTTFYNIGDLEVQDNIARVWVDIGTREPLLLDILVNALMQISSDYVGIKQLAFGGSAFESWSEDLKTEDVGYSVHKI